MMRTLIPLPLLALPLLALTAGCTVGPDYGRPPAVGSTEVAGNRFVRGADAVQPDAPTAARWWTALGDPTLEMLETRALASNPGLAAAEARVRESRAALRLERANQLPSGSASAVYLHARLPGINLDSNSSDSSATDNGSETLNFYNVGFDASWEVDLFGGKRRSTEAARATLGASEASLADAQVQLGAEIAQAYVNLRDRQQRLELVHYSVGVQRRMLELSSQRLAQGTASELDVERLRTQAENTKAESRPLAADIDAYLNALAVLTGSEPGTLDALLATRTPTPRPPAAVAIGDPAALLKRRPDIRAAERKLAAATAKIGVADAARFPKLSFMGILGLGGTSVSDLTDLDSLAALAVPQLQWNFLDFGRNLARVHQAEASRDEAEAQYRQAVLAALQDAEDSLSRFGHRRETIASLARVKVSADHSAALMDQRYRAGTASLIDALDAERQRVAAEQNLAQATAALTGDFIAIQKALGLGWQAAGPDGSTAR